MTALSADRPDTSRVAIVIVNYRTPALTMRCLAALRGERNLVPNLKVIVVDGGSDDASPKLLAAGIDGPEYRGWVSFLPLDLNGGFGWANNQAILGLAADDDPPDYVHLLNPDTEITGGAVLALVQEMQGHARCGAAGSQLLTKKGEVAASAFRFPSPSREFINAARSEKLGRLLGIASTVVRASGSAEVDWVSGASVLFRAEALRDAGLFDDGFFLYFEEVELMHRLRASGWKTRHVPASRVVHAEGASTGLVVNRTTAFPAYWYQSRRRYFALTGGLARALGASLSWLAGRALGKVKDVARGSQAASAARARDVLRTGLLPSRRDILPAVPAWGDPPGRPPAWMTRG
jgi:GT2 family glycosyltransferase